jgi:hypothetical protein
MNKIGRKQDEKRLGRNNGLGLAWYKTYPEVFFKKIVSKLYLRNSMQVQEEDTPCSAVSSFLGDQQMQRRILQKIVINI